MVDSSNPPDDGDTPADDTPAGGEPSLEDLVIALQKSFSRVGAKTQNAAERLGDSASIARIAGPVQYSMTVSLSPHAEVDSETSEREHTLRHARNGSINLRLDGELTLDVRVEEAPSVDDPKDEN